MNSKALELKAKGVDVFAFGVGEPDFEPPEAVREAAKRAIDAGCSKYTAVTGIPALKEAICDATERSRGWRPKNENVCVSVGAKHTLFNLALALYEPGDEVVIPKPYWVSYPEQVRLVGATPVLVDTREEDGWKLSPAELEKALTPRTKAVILCTPSNPTGLAYTEDETRALVDVVRKSDCWLIVDEIYAELVYEGLRFVSAAKIAPDLRDRMVVVDGVSKTYAMTGWRIGWALAPAPLIKALDVVQGQSTTNPTAVAQHAARRGAQGPERRLRAHPGDVREAPQRDGRRALGRFRASSAASPTARSTRSPTCAASMASTGTERRSRPTRTSRSGCSRRRTSRRFPAAASARRGTFDSATRRAKSASRPAARPSAPRRPRLARSTARSSNTRESRQDAKTPAEGFFSDQSPSSGVLASWRLSSFGRDPGPLELAQLAPSASAGSDCASADSGWCEVPRGCASNPGPCTQAICTTAAFDAVANYTSTGWTGYTVAIFDCP